MLLNTVHVFQARKSVALLKDWKPAQLPLLSALSSELTVQRENLIYHLGDEWKRLVIWKLPPSKGEVSRETDLSYLLLKLDGLFIRFFFCYILKICHYVVAIIIFPQILLTRSPS